MSEFIQLHVLTCYPASNLNRDDLGRPKTVNVGGTNRLRISSQCLKRTIRTSSPEKTSIRSKALGEAFKAEMTKNYPSTDPDVINTLAANLAEAVAGKIDTKKKDAILNTTLAFYSVEEWHALVDLAVSLLSDEGEELRKIVEKDIKSKVLAKAISDAMDTGTRSAHVAMFGRMFAANHDRDVDAAVQVAHSMTVHEATVEDDFFTAVDDRSSGEDDDQATTAGSGHMGETGFGAGVFYTYVNINRTDLIENLSHDLSDPIAVADEGIEDFIRALTTVSPSGKQNSFAHQTRASFVLAERGTSQPRSLAGAFLDPVTFNEGYLKGAISRLMEMRQNISAAYGDRPAAKVLDVNAGTGTLDEIIQFCTGD